jgi:threonine/homoserine/homoserine lactone efflux protein
MNFAIINSQLLLTFMITAAVIVVVPGPSVMFIVSRALTGGRPAALAAAAGNTLGATFQGLVAALGLGTLIAESEMLYSVLKFGGALYLVSMGATTLRNRESAPAADGSSPTNGPRRSARQGFLVGLTNPKTIVFFAAALPQFVDRTRGHVVLQRILLTVYSFLSLASDTSWGFAGGSLRTMSANSPRLIQRFIGAGGICIIALGGVLALSHG